MSEFIEIGGCLHRVKDILNVRPYDGGGSRVEFDNGDVMYPDDSYESVRDKLLGKNRGPDPRAVFARQLADWFRKDGFGKTAQMVEQFYSSMMLSETEGAG